MQWRNTTKVYGSVSVTLHWGLAMAVIAMFCLGLWMTSLDYYHPWYKKGPDLHRSIGVIVVSIFVLRYLWRIANTRPQALHQHKTWEIHLARFTHGLFYLLMPAMAISGYLITTADGRSLEVFKIFEIPAIIEGVDNLEDDAGLLHLCLAWTTISLAFLHAAGALKHHLIDRDNTLKRMLGIDDSTPKT